jgi:hypothetical protein
LRQTQKTTLELEIKISLKLQDRQVGGHFNHLSLVFFKPYLFSNQVTFCFILNRTCTYDSGVGRAPGIEVVTCVSHTLYSTEAVVAKNGGRPPLSYRAFERTIAALGPPPAPAEDPPAKLPPLGPISKEEITSVPSLAELGYPPKASTDIKA